MGIVIRRVAPEEASEYVACHIACWRSAYRGIITDEYLDNMLLERERRTEDCRRALCAPGSFEFLCAEQEEKMTGRLIIGKSRDEDKPDAGEIAAIYLLEEFWGKGYGRQMMEYATDRLKCGGYSEVIVWVLEENNRARRFYEKCGFVFDGTKKEITFDTPLITMRYVRLL